MVRESLLYCSKLYGKLSFSDFLASALSYRTNANYSCAIIISRFLLFLVQRYE